MKLGSLIGRDYCSKCQNHIVAKCVNNDFFELESICSKCGNKQRYYRRDGI